MAIKKSEIYSQIWAACDKLRGGVEPARYKDYILTLLFIKYVSDCSKSNRNLDIIVPRGGSFDDIAKLKRTKNIGEGINVVIGKLAKKNDLGGIIDIADFNSEELGNDKEAQDKLSGLIAIFQKPELDFSLNRAGGDDILGDAYEYLMSKFAVESGKSKGQFYTPGEVSRIMAKVIGIDKASGSDKSVYDPACGSGSLLIRAADEAPKKRDGSSNVAIYGQEKERATAGLARMNLALHNKAFGEVAGNKSTLANPQYKEKDNPNQLKRFDYIVMNPPFSDKSWTDGVNDPDDWRRFEGFGTPPEKNGDYAWFLHVLKSLKSTGKAAIIMPHGVLFRGNAEEKIRKAIIDKGYIKGIIGLPANLFFGTGIPACIIVLDKEDAVTREGIFMIDASKGFIKDGNKNRLREQDIYKIVRVFNSQKEIEKYSRFVPNNEVKTTNEYNLNIPRYIDSSEMEDLQDIGAHLSGGIPVVDIDGMSAFWHVYPNLKKILFKPLRKGYYAPLVEKDAVVDTITSHKEFLNHAGLVDAAYTGWKDKVTPVLKKLDKGADPKTTINLFSDMLLAAFEKVLLIDQYDVYQVLMEYWVETMQDDIYAICFDGFITGREIAYNYTVKKEKKNGVTSEVFTDKVKGFEGRLIPKTLIVEQFFAKEQEAIVFHQEELESLSAQIEEFVQENTGEGDNFIFSTDDDANKLFAKNRIKEIEDDTAYADELVKLNKYLDLLEKESTAKKFVKEAAAILEKAVLEKYQKLTDKEIKELLIEKKWFHTIFNGIDAIHNAVSHRLSSHVSELVERYEFALPQCQKEAAELENKVQAHLERMRFAW